MSLPRASSSVTFIKKGFHSVFPWRLKADISPGDGLDRCSDLRYEQWMRGSWTITTEKGSAITEVKAVTLAKNAKRKQAGDWFQDLLDGQDPTTMTVIKTGSAALCSVDDDVIGTIHYQFDDAPGSTQNLAGSPGYMIGDLIFVQSLGWGTLEAINFNLQVTHKLWTAGDYRIHERTFELTGGVTRFKDDRRLIAGAALP